METRDDLRVLEVDRPMLSLLPALALLLAMETLPDTLSDDALVAYASSPFDKKEMAFHHENLGVHHGALVVADFPCSDLCPSYTVRVIHYDVEPGPECEKVGGVVRAQRIPISITTAMREFCVPKILADKQLY